MIKNIFIKSNKGQQEISTILAIVVFFIIGVMIINVFSQQAKIDKLERDLNTCNANLNYVIEANIDLNQKYEDCQEKLADKSILEQIIKDLPKKQNWFNGISAFFVLFVLFVVVKPILFKIKFDGSALIDKVFNKFDDLEVGWFKYILIGLFWILFVVFVITLILVFLVNFRLFFYKF